MTSQTWRDQRHLIQQARAFFPHPPGQKSVGKKFYWTCYRCETRLGRRTWWLLVVEVPNEGRGGGDGGRDGELLADAKALDGGDAVWTWGWLFEESPAGIKWLCVVGTVQRYRSHHQTSADCSGRNGNAWNWKVGTIRLALWVKGKKKSDV